jgi:hypothetical protein
VANGIGEKMKQREEDTMPIGLNREELTKAFMMSQPEILKEFQTVAKGKTTVNTEEHIVAVISLIIGKTTEVILANNQRIADQLAAAGIAL